MSILDVLVPAEPIVGGFSEPRVVCFGAPGEMGSYESGKNLAKLLTNRRVRQVNDAIVALGGECLSAQIAESTGIKTPVVSRILQIMRRDGLVSSRRIPGSTSRMWVLI